MAASIHGNLPPSRTPKNPKNELAETFKANCRFSNTIHMDGFSSVFCLRLTALRSATKFLTNKGINPSLCL